MEDLLTILNGCIDNDSRSQKVLYERYLNYTLKIAFRYISSYEDAAIVANDAFIKIFRSLHKFEIRNHTAIEAMFMGWMRKIVITTSLDHLRKESAMNGKMNYTEALEIKISSSNDGQNQLLYDELIGLVKRLSPGYRAVFNLYVIDGYSHKEIAAILGITEGTSKSNLSKAKAFLQKLLIKDKRRYILCST
ncbi:MAG: RNA polymerase sigma factor [Ginsengibacter sp.]